MARVPALYTAAARRFVLPRQTRSNPDPMYAKNSTQARIGLRLDIARWHTAAQDRDLWLRLVNATPPSFLDTSNPLTTPAHDNPPHTLVGCSLYDQPTPKQIGIKPLLSLSSFDGSPPSRPDPTQAPRKRQRLGQIARVTLWDDRHVGR